MRTMKGDAYHHFILAVTGTESIQPTSLLKAWIHLNLKLSVQMEAFGKAEV
jgi:hypothetical protein